MGMSPRARASLSVSFTRRLIVLWDRAVIRTISLIRRYASLGFSGSGSVLGVSWGGPKGGSSPKTSHHRSHIALNSNWLRVSPFSFVRLSNMRITSAAPARRKRAEMPGRACIPGIPPALPVLQPQSREPWSTSLRRCRQPRWCPPLGLRRSALVGITARLCPSPSLFAATPRWVQMGV